MNARLIATKHRRDAAARPWDTLRFLLTTPELSNFTYDLENTEELLALAAGALGRPAQELIEYGRELEADTALRERLRARLATRKDRLSEPRYGKRIVSYALVRATKPAIVAETGTHDGFGSVVLAAALRRNTLERHPGRLLTFDINPDAGWLISDVDRPLVTQHIGAAVEMLPEALAGGVDFFIHDSLRTVSNEQREYELALDAARGERLYLLCDDVSVTDVLSRLCKDRGVPLTVMNERPKRHWWRGNAVGFACIPLLDADAAPAG